MLSGGLDRATLVVAGVATLGLIMAVLDTTIVNVALDTLSRELHSPLSRIQWVSTGYLLSLAAVIPLSGWLTERFGSKRTWIASIALFAAGSGLCALATSAGELIGFRILQGLGGGMLMPVGFTLIAQSAGPRRVGRALAAVGVPILLGPIFGPIIGGLIVDNASWQWIFVVNVPIAGAAILLAARVLKPDAGRVDAGKLDWLGAALLCPGLTGIVFGLSETETHGGITHLIALGPIVAGIALVGLFIRHSLQVERPLIDLRLFRSRGFRAAATTTFFLGAALFGTLLILPLYYQVDRGESALNAGLLLAPQGIGAALMLPISGRLTDRAGGGPVVLAGCLVLTVATVPFMFVTEHTPYLLLAGVLFVRGVGLGAAVQPSVAAAYQLLDSAQVPRATAALNTLRQIGGSIGTTLLAVVLQHEGRAALSSLPSAAGGLLTPLPNAERVRISGPVATAFDHAFLWALLIALLTIVPAAGLIHAERVRGPRTRRRRHRTGDSAEAGTARHVRRPIEASRTLSAPSEVVLRFLSDLENHARLAPTSVSVLSLNQQDDLSTRAFVRLRGPLAIHRTASTDLRRPTASSIAGRAKIGSATVASVTWNIQTLRAGSVVTLCATVDAAGPLDAVLLRVGGRRWLAKRFDAALENLSLELSDDPAHSDADSSSEQQSWPGLTPGIATAHLGSARPGT